MTAITDEGVRARDMVLRTLGGMRIRVPEWAVDVTDWDEMAQRGTNAILEEAHMTWDEYQAELERQLRWTDGQNRAAQATAYEEQARALLERTRRAKVPPRYEDVPLNMDDAERLEAGRGMYVYGRQGSGKTFRACSALRGWLSRNRGRALFTTSVGMLYEVTATYSSAETAESVLEKYGGCEVLVIDDLGKENPTANSLSILWYLLNMRYERNLPTIVTTQYDGNELVSRLALKGDAETARSMVSRLFETCDAVDMGQYDMRLSS